MATATRPQLLALALALSFGSTLGASASAAALPADTDVPAPAATQADPERAPSRPLALAIAGPDDDPELAPGLRPSIEESLRRMGMEPTDGAPHGVFIVIGVDEMAPDAYQIDIHLELGPEAEAIPSTVSLCTRCGSAGLLSLIDRQLAKALHRLPPSPRKPDEAPAEEIPVTPPIITPPEPAPGPRLRTRGIVGAALLGVGVSSVATGAALWVKRVSDHPSRPNWELHLRPPAIALMAAGGAAAVAGGVLVGLDLARPKPSRLSAAPMFGAGVAGVTMRGRF